jgi:hypothetical protein
MDAAPDGSGVRRGEVVPVDTVAVELEGASAHALRDDAAGVEGRPLHSGRP